MKLGIFHNSDLDGHCSGAILKHKMSDIILIGMEHGDPVPWALIKDAEEVFMVDFCLNPFEEMQKVRDLLREKFVWIDHHISAINKYNSSLDRTFCVNINGKRNTSKAACELTWEYLYPGKRVPRFVELLGKYDSWRNQDKKEWEEEILPFEYGMLSMDTNPANNMKTWNDLFVLMDIPILRDVSISSISHCGRSILSYLNRKNHNSAERGAYPVEVDGLRGIAINSETHSSMVLESVYNPELHDIMVIYSHTKEQKWYVSFYSTKDNVDCSKIALKLGGGGHRGASGATVDELPFKII
jgi:uncharacterized protein